MEILLQEYENPDINKAKLEIASILEEFGDQELKKYK